MLQVAADLHREPIYQEISPKNNKTIINEFISGETNSRYLMINNNPNAIYATVNKTAKNLIKRKSLDSVCEEPVVQRISEKKVNAQSKSASPARLSTVSNRESRRASSGLRRSLFNSSTNSGDRSLSSVEESNGVLLMPAQDTEDDESLAMVTALEVQEDIIVPKSAGKVGASPRRSGENTHAEEYRTFRNDIQSENCGTRGRGGSGGLTCEEQLLQTVIIMEEETSGGRVAPLGSIDSDDEVSCLIPFI